MTHHTYRSPCCDAPIRVEGETTRYYVCDACGEACVRQDLEYEEDDDE